MGGELRRFILLCEGIARIHVEKTKRWVRVNVHSIFYYRLSCIFCCGMYAGSQAVHGTDVEGRRCVRVYLSLDWRCASSLMNIMIYLIIAYALRAW